MKIILAKSAGFCFGVRRAVELTEQTAAKVAESGGAAKVFTFGELIHNRDVVNRLREAGIAPIEALNEAQCGDYVIIRSHGVPKKIYEELETRGINFIDATCPFVSNIHRIVSAAYERGEQVFIVGNPEHPETIGINGHCGNSAIFIRSEEELRKLGRQERLPCGSNNVRFRNICCNAARYRTRISPHSRVQQHMQHNLRTAAGGRGIKQEMRCYACFR